MTRSRLFSLLLSLSLFLTISVSPAFAAGGEANTLVSSSVVDGDSNISTKPVIELEFSGKVDDLSVVATNKDSFHLQNASGNVQELEVFFPDVQIQNRFSSHVFLTPTSPLLAGQEYVLTIDPSVSDKKGNLLGQTLQIHFTTATDETFANAKENEDLLSLGSDILSYKTASAPGAVAAVEDTETVSPDGVSEESSSVPPVISIAIPVLLLLLAGMFYMNWKKSKGRSSED